MSHPTRRIVIVLGFLLLFSLAIVACGGTEQVEVTRVVEVTREVEGEAEPVEVEVTRVVEVEVEGEPAVEVPFIDLWTESPHNRAEDEAFVHWDEDGEISESCAKCHSTPGFKDYVGADGSEVNVVNEPAPLGSTVECTACHNEVTVDMTSVLFPSGIEVTDLGDEAVCLQCHQGRESTVSVNESISELGLEGDPDTANEELGFRNIHYYAAAATMYGTVVKGGFEYEGKAYDAKFDHVPEYGTCIDCHNPHTLELKYDECSQCHEGLTSEEELENVRMAGSLVDYDGDGDMSEGISMEIDGLREMLYTAITTYSDEVLGQPVAYSGEAYPYFFSDLNADGEAGEDEANFGNRYSSFSPRLLKAAYNYQVSLKDPGRFAQGGKYIIQLLYDSIEDLNEALSTPVDLSAAHRLDHGHFAGSEEAFRHWDEDGAVPGSCSRCHSAAGLPLFIEQGAEIEQPTANGLNCATCHSDLTTFALYEVTEVPFPSGATLAFEDSPESNLCINCHQGRSWSGSVESAVEGLGDDEVAENLRFINIHYFAAGATLFGNQAQGAYQYAGQEYVGQFEHVGPFNTCIECHDAHMLTVVVDGCANCHEGVESEEDLQTIRVSETDFDGDGDVEEGLAGEVGTMTDALYAAIQAYVAGVDGAAAIVYDSHSYPYFFTDLNENGEADPDEANYGNRYATWTPTLLRAAYNYQYAQKDPGAFAHNGQYVLQVLYDSINAVGGDVSAMTRP
ncbi:MAG: cytochrome c3 family protein [Candidatus Promineifilaceae bacterium]|nr:cytochrome c3 family protein [Candidatus Promineifilaceae bacterium]